MSYAYDRAIPLPVKDLYDKQIMAMSINAAKDMYEKGQKQIDDFYTKYGDFTSPIQKDMDWYAQNVTGKASDFINQLYANGVDPLRSAEGRAAVAQLVRSMPIGDIAKLRQSAATAKEYLKSIDDTTNPELERFLGRDLSQWSTLGGNGDTANGIWGISKASKYQDLNQYTSHIFDNLKDSYLGTDKNHYDWYGVTEDHMKQALTPDKLGGLLNTPLGQFHYQNAIRDLAAQGISNPTEAQKMEQFRNNIIAANHERVHQDKKLNDLWKLEEEGRQRMRAAAIAHPQPTQIDPQWSFAELVRRSGTTAILGAQVQEYNEKMPGVQRDAQIEFGKYVMKATGSKSYKNEGLAMYKQKYGQNVYRRQDIINYLSSMGYKTTSDGQSVIIPKSDLNKLNTLASLSSMTAGYRNRKIGVSLGDLQNADVIVYTPSGGSYQAFMKNGRNEAHFEGQIKAVKYKRDNGALQLDEKGNPIVDLNNIKYNTFYLDSDIKSVKNDSRLGSLKGPKGQAIVNTQDTRYQNAIQSDKETTDKIIKGTVYGSDAILSEEGGYAYNKQ